MSSARTEGSTAAKPRRQRPSKARGLRTSTGCLTCRSRRVKCDEERPRCRQCSKSQRNCTYNPPSESCASADQSGALNLTSAETPREPHTPSFEQPLLGTSSVASPNLFTPEDNQNLSVTGSTNPDNGFEIGNLDFSLLEEMAAFSPGAATLEWYDLLAQDAIRSIQQHNLTSSGPRWDIDERSLSRRQSPIPEAASTTTYDANSVSNVVPEPWNTVNSIILSTEELVCFQYYVNVVGPILDLFDPAKHFTDMVPHLALRNVGLLKSLLAVAARHMSLHGVEVPADRVQDPHTPNSTSSTVERHAATRYYYDTLSYLSQAMAYPSYTKSLEILATAVMIGTYEMFDGSNRDWERHLKGAFWIQRCQENNGESGGLRMAVWWAWLRQDIWAAFRDRRKTLTIWRPTKPLAVLSPDELATRILYLLAQVVQYASTEEMEATDITMRIEQGNKLLELLSDWHDILPASFRPIPTRYDAKDRTYEPMWIHPPSHAAAIQYYHFARILLLLNQPSLGGINAYRVRQTMLDESTKVICGLASSSQSKQLPSVIVSFQALFAAGLCVPSGVKKAEVLELFKGTLDTNKWPPKQSMIEVMDEWSKTL